MKGRAQREESSGRAQREECLGRGRERSGKEERGGIRVSHGFARRDVDLMLIESRSISDVIFLC